MEKILGLAACGIASLAGRADYRYENTFDVHDEAGHAYGIEVEKTSQYSHGHGTVTDDGYCFLISGAKHFLETPKLRDCSLTVDFSEATHPFEVFEVGMQAFFRWDRDTNRGCAVKFYWASKAQFCIEVNGELVYSRQDSRIPADIRGTLELTVQGDRATGSYLGTPFAFDVPAGTPASGYVALDVGFSPGTQATARCITLQSPETPERTCVRDWQIVMNTKQGFQEPLRYDIVQYRYASGETAFEAKLSGTIMDRGPRIETGGGEWCSILDRLTDPYVRFETAAGEIRNCLFYNGCRTLKDRKLCETMGPRCSAYDLQSGPWPLARTWMFRHFPEDFTVAAGHGYATSTPWRFAENGPYERICARDGGTLYEGGSLRKGLAAIDVTPVADGKILARVPTDVPNRDKALKHAATCGYFSESTAPSFSYAVSCRADDFAESELTATARIESVYGDPVASVAETRAAVESLPGGFRRTVFSARAARPLPVGVYHFVVDWNAGDKPRQETFVFESLPDDPNGPCPPLASGLPTLYAVPNEIKYLETSPLDPWADFGGMGHYYTILEVYPAPGLAKCVDRFVPLYRRKWWTHLGGRNMAQKTLEDPEVREIMRRADLVEAVGPKGNSLNRFDFAFRSAYNGEQLQLLRGYVAERRPPLKVLTLAGIDGHFADRSVITVEEFKDLFDTCWDDFLAWARPKIAEKVRLQNEAYLAINPRIGHGGGGPYSIYVTNYKSPYVLKYSGWHVDCGSRINVNGSFFQFEDYHYSCDYPLTRAAYFVSGYTLHYPKGRPIYPEIYYTDWERCNDGAVFYAHPNTDTVLADTHQRRVVYQYCYGTPSYSNGAWNYWRGYGYHARNPEKGSLREFVYAWGKMLRNKPARPLKAPYFVLDLAEIGRHGDYWEDETCYLINLRFDGRNLQPDINNTAEEDLGYTYEQCSAAGYNTPVLTTYADLGRLTPETCEFVVLPPVVKGTPKKIVDSIRAAHARGLNLVCFEAVEGLEDLFGVKPADERAVRCVEGEVFSHKLARTRHAAAGADVLMYGATSAAAKADIPILFANRRAHGCNVFFAVPPTVVSRSTRRENFCWGQANVSEAMKRAARAAFAAASGAPAVRTERGEISAVVTEKGDIAVAVNESTPIYGNTTKYPASFRFTVSAPGVGAMKIEGDAKFRVIAQTADSVTLRTETEADTAHLFVFRKQ